ncbi:S9 family peptidase [Acidobacterium sp. S8]|uniref:S9 family peptidase n=1 Tax=Acidobacterium sp. S8 TaxID=1641854 RepID=UPI0020B10DA6|nr:S9 family peptidase [Acidobacterium sp. S8]
MMLSRISLLVLAAAFALPDFAQQPAAATASAAPSAPHGMTLDDLFRFQDVGDPEVSPDGKWVAYTVSTIDTTADKRLTDIWMVNWDGSQDIRLTYADAESSSTPRWSPDGKYISFTSGRPGKTKGSQVWVLDRRGGEARQLTDVKNHLSFYAWSPDAKKLLLSIAEDKDAEAKEKDKDKEKEKPKPIVIDRYHFKQDIEGYISSETTPTLLYLFDVETHKLEKLTTDTKYNEENPTWSPDGTQIAYVSNHNVDPDRTTNTDVFVVDAKLNSAPRKLTTFNGPDGGHMAWSPDSKLIAYLHGSEPKYLEYNQSQLAVVPAAGGEPRVLTAKLDRAVSSPIFAADGQSVTVLVTDDRSEYPAAVSLSDGTVKRLVDTPGTVMRQDAAAGHTAMVWTTDTAPGEVYAFDDGKLRKLTTHNDALLAQLKLGETRDLQAKTKDGADVHALLTLPVGYQAGQKFPMLLRIHGGPDAQDAHAFVTERQLFAARGYAVLNVNYRGSAGRSAAYQQIIFADWGDKEVIDLLACVDEAVKEGVADPDRLGVGGWSYGGISTDYTIASTNRFKAAISGAGMGNPLGFYGVDQYIVQYDQELGPPWKALDTYLKLGYPLLHADRIHTPTLFMGGDKDFNVPLVGGEQMYQALRSLNVPTELVVYPGQFHGFTRPSFIRDRYQRYFAWYDKYLMPASGTKK